MNIFLRFPNGLNKALTLSYDDGYFSDIRLVEILNNNGIKCTFNLNSASIAQEDAVDWGHLSLKQAKECYSGHEIAAHTLTHARLEKLPIHLATAEVLEDRKALEDMFGTMVRGMAYPHGTHNDSVVNMLEACGIAYARTTENTLDFSIPDNWLRMSVTCDHTNSKLFEFADMFLEDKPYLPSKLFHVFGHTCDFDNNNNWNVIEEFAEKLGNRDDVWYATNIEIYDYVSYYNRLVFSANGHRAYNPNVKPIWFFAGGFNYGKTIKVEPGETVDF